MRFFASLILACCLASPAFAGQEFCQINNPGGCGAHSETAVATQTATMQNTAPILGHNGFEQRHAVSSQDDHIGFTLLDLDLINIETPSTAR